MNKIQPKDCNEHEQTAGLREDEKFNCGIDSVFVTPNSDQQVHGNQHRFPKEVKKDQIRREKYPDDACETGHQIEMKKTHPFPNLCPRAHHRCYSQEDGQGHHEKAQTVHGQLESYPPLGDPLEISSGNPNRG